MSIVGGYTLDLYCDNSNIIKGKITDGIHQYNEFPHIYFSELGSECRSEARKEGWILKRNGNAICPKCNKMGKR